MYLKRTLRGTAIVFVFSILGLLLSYAFRILLARKLTIGEYGLFFSVFSFFSIFTVFIDLGLTQAVSKSVIDLNIKKKFVESKSILFSTMIFQFLISFLLFIMFVILPESYYLNIFQLKAKDFVLLMGIWFLTLPLVNFITNIFIGHGRVELASSLEVFRQGCAFIITAILIYSGIGPQSPFFAYLCINFLMLLFYLPIVGKMFKKFVITKYKINFKQLKPLFKFGYYVTISGLISMIITQTDSIMLTIFKGTVAVGLYQIALPISMLILYFSTSVLTVAYPVLVELNAKKQKDYLKDAFNLLYKYTLVISIPVAIAVFSYPEFFITLLFDAKYLAAADTLRLLSIMTLFSLVTGISNTVLLATGNPSQMSKAMVFAALTNFILNLILIPKYSIVGAATASVFSFIVAFVFSQASLKKSTGLQFPISSLFKITSVSIVMFFIVDYLKKIIYANVWLQLGVIATICAVIYLTLLFALKILEISEIKHFINTFFGKKIINT